MFEKLLSLLPYNPGLSHQMAFYSRRMREEATIRRTGLIFIVLAFMIQFFAVISPPQPTVASSSNDLVNGGFSSAADAARNCRQNVRGYGEILNNYGITCDQVASAPTVTIHATDYNKRLMSMGHLPYGKPGETPVNVKGSTLYFRFLWGWPYGSQTIKVLKIIAHGKTYFLMYECGNLVSIGLPQPEELCKYNRALPADSPKCFQPCKYNKNIPAGSDQCFQPCKYDKNVAANNPKCFQPCKYDKNVAANSDKCVAPCKYNRNLASNSPLCFSPCKYDKSIPASSKKCFAPCPVNGKSNIPQSSPQCFEPCPYNSKISAGNAQCAAPCQYNSAILSTSEQCFQPCTFNNALPADSSQCFQPCQYNNTIAADSASCFQPCEYNASISSDSSQCYQPCQYNSSISADSAQCFQPCSYNHNISADSPDCYQPCQYNNTISNSDSACKPCEQSVSSEDAAACITVSKSASNDTQNIGNADGTTAHASDVITYTLSAINNGKATVKAFVFQENVSDVLDYADVTDPHGGTMDHDGNITWPAENIKAGATASHQVTVKVKNPIPATPTSSSDPGHFDLIMTNVYGNTVNIKLPGTPAQSVETTAANLPNTGPGTALFLAGLAVMFAGYFYCRSALLAKESRLALQEMANG